jgi:hypothetical protein
VGVVVLERLARPLLATAGRAGQRLGRGEGLAAVDRELHLGRRTGRGPAQVAHAERQALGHHDVGHRLLAGVAHAYRVMDLVADVEPARGDPAPKFPAVRQGLQFELLHLDGRLERAGSGRLGRVLAIGILCADRTRRSGRRDPAGQHDGGHGQPARPARHGGLTGAPGSVKQGLHRGSDFARRVGSGQVAKRATGAWIACCPLRFLRRNVELGLFPHLTVQVESFIVQCSNAAMQQLWTTPRRPP